MDSRGRRAQDLHGSKIFTGGLGLGDGETRQGGERGPSGPVGGGTRKAMDHWRAKASPESVSYTHMTLPTTPYV